MIDVCISHCILITCTSSNALSPVWQKKATTQTSSDFLSIRPLEKLKKNVYIYIRNLHFSIEEMHLEMSSVKCLHFVLAPI